MGQTQQPFWKDSLQKSKIILLIRFLAKNNVFVLFITRLKKFSPRPRGKSVIGKILFEYMIKVEKVLFSKSVC